MQAVVGAELIVAQQGRVDWAVAAVAAQTLLLERQERLI
jgi:hypothetical protein